MKYEDISQALTQLKAGGIIILLDDTGSTLKSYCLSSAEKINQETIAWMINYGKSLVFLVSSEKEARDRNFYPTSTDNSLGFRLSHSIEAREGVKSGISAFDRATTINAFCQATRTNKTVVSPGHVFPVIAKDGGLLVSYGSPEACTSLLKAAGNKEIGVFMPLLNTKGQTCNKDDITFLSSKFNLPLVSISNLTKYLLIKEPLIVKEAETSIPTKEFGTLVAHGFKSIHDQVEHIAFTINLDTIKDTPVLTRMHSENKLGDIFNIQKNGGREKLRHSLQQISQAGSGAFVYIRKSNFGSTSAELENKKTSKTKFHALRELGVGAQILKSLEIQSIKLISSSNSNLPDLSAFNIRVVKNI